MPDHRRRIHSRSLRALAFAMIGALAMFCDTSFSQAQTSSQAGKSSQASKNSEAGAGSQTDSTGQETRPETNSNRKDAPARKQPRPTAEMQRRVQEFAAAHHTELESLLSNLRKKSRPEYDTAVRQLFTTLERLERLQKRDAQRYAVELRAWQLDTTVQVLAARLSMTRDPEIQEQLRDALQQRLAVRLEQLTLERQRVATRLEQLDTNLRELQQHSDEAVQRDLDRILRIVRSRETTARRQQDRSEQRTKNAVTEPTKKPAPQ